MFPHQLDALCYSKDRQGVYLNVNPGFVTFADIRSASDALGRNDKALPWAAFEPVCRENDCRVMSTEKTHIFIEHSIFQGMPRLYRSFKSPLLGNTGKVVGILGVSIPIKITSLIPLTKQQTACLKQLALGLTLKQIAVALGLSPKTVEHYLDTVKIKLNCQSRSELILQAIERGLINFL